LPTCDLRHVLRLIVLAVLPTCSLVTAEAAIKPRPGRLAPGWTSPLAPRIQVGSLRLVRCPVAPAYCGSLVRPLDPAGEVSGSIAIGFEFFPHRDPSQPALGTIVAEEGGPGYPSTGTRSSYVGLYAPLMDRRDLLLVDNRGTGKSHAIDCETLQRSPYLFERGIAECGAHLGPISDLYGSALAADDLAAVLDALGIERIDLYGDSYGTFFSQTFAGRHPKRIRSLVLDSAYPVIGESPWYPEAAPAARRAFQAACERSLTCRDLPGDSLDRIVSLLESLRANPVQGQAYDGDGRLRRVTADPRDLAELMFSNGSGPVVYRELDAAARAYLEQGDAAPLLRLLAENFFVSQSGNASRDNPRYYSAGLFVAVSCSDYPQIYAMTSDPTARHAQRDQAFVEEEAAHPDVYAPFSLREFNSMKLDYSVLDTCLRWPVPSPAHPPGQPVPPGATFTSAPVLVLSGDLDSLTPAAQGKKAAALFPHAQQVIVLNSFHVTALGDEDDCASEIVRHFVEFLDPGDTSCAQRIAEVRTVPTFAHRAAELAPAAPIEGNQGTPTDLSVAAAAAFTAGDAIARWWMNLSGSGVGFRGGTFQYSFVRGGYRFQLANDRWVEDVAVSGVIEWAYSTGTVVAHLTLKGPGTEPGTLDLSWDDRRPHATALIRGRIGGRRIAAQMYAP
jgi:pimeloyl-ACP methyl ester carboxylesterase